VRCPCQVGVAEIRLAISRKGALAREDCGMLDDTALRAALQQHWEFSGEDEDRAHEIYADDAVLEFPQSRERFEGLKNFIEWRKAYPAKLNFKLRKIRRREDFVVTEYNISYDNKPWQFCVSVMELVDDKVAHEHIYIMEGWEAPAWRDPWRSDRLSCDNA
jgi:hypothetical protein